MLTFLRSQTVAHQRPPWARYGGAFTGSAAEETARIVVVIEEIMSAIYRAPQVGEIG